MKKLLLLFIILASIQAEAQRKTCLVELFTIGDPRFDIQSTFERSDVVFIHWEKESLKSPEIALQAKRRIQCGSGTRESELFFDTDPIDMNRWNEYYILKIDSVLHSYDTHNIHVSRSKGKVNVWTQPGGEVWIFSVGQNTHTVHNGTMGYVDEGEIISYKLGPYDKQIVVIVQTIDGIGGIRTLKIPNDEIQ